MLAHMAPKPLTAASPDVTRTRSSNQKKFLIAAISNNCYFKKKEFKVYSMKVVFSKHQKHMSKITYAK